MKFNRKYFLTLLTFLVVATKANAETILTTHAVISDVYVDTIPEGVCHVKGRVYEAESQMMVDNAYVGDVNRKYFATTDVNGNYELQVNAGDSTLFFFKEGYQEIVCWNYKFKSQHLVTIDFLTGAEAQQGMYMEAEKPVVYLYADQETNLQLTLKPKGHFTFTYPLYKNGWQVNVKPNSPLQVEGKEYPYLFWEGEQAGLNFVKTNNELHGYFIDTDSTVQFLENTLSQLGLNAQEQTDFITYWGPRLMHYNFATIQIFVDEEYETNIAELDASIKIDSQRRVYMLFKGTDLGFCPYGIKTPVLSGFEREGLTLIEWGGTEL